MKDQEIIERNEYRLVASIMSRAAIDTGFRASIKKADNPDTEFYSWEILAEYGVDLRNEVERKACCTILAAAVRSESASDGNISLGKALVLSYGGESDNSAARARLRRLLSVQDVPELCSVLRSLLKFIQGKGIRIGYGKLLSDIDYFAVHPDKVKANWAQQFFDTTES